MDPAVNIFELPTFNVLVTGFDRFKGPDANASFASVSQLPNSIYHEGPRDGAPSYRARLFVYPAAIPTSYKTVQEVIPAIFGTTHFDYIVHCGMAPPPAIRLESCAHKDANSKTPDVDGKHRDPSLEPAYYSDMPDILHTDVDVEAVVPMWRRNTIPRIKEAGIPFDAGELLVRSDDAGRYMCCYIYYASMAWVRHTQANKTPRTVKRFEQLPAAPQKTHVVFCHVPPELDKESIQRNCIAIEELVHALIKTGLKGS